MRRRGRGPNLRLGSFSPRWLLLRVKAAMFARIGADNDDLYRAAAPDFAYCRPTTSSLAMRAAPGPISKSIHRGGDLPHKYGDRITLFNAPQRACYRATLGPDAYGVNSTYTKDGRVRRPPSVGHGYLSPAARPTACVADARHRRLLFADSETHALFGDSMGHPPSPSCLPRRTQRTSRFSNLRPSDRRQLSRMEQQTDFIDFPSLAIGRISSNTW